MIAVETFISVDVKVRRDDKPTLDFGSYRFRVLPRVGEIIHVHYGETPYSLKIQEIEHQAYTDDSKPTFRDTVIVFKCRIVEDNAPNY